MNKRLVFVCSMLAALAAAGCGKPRASAGDDPVLSIVRDWQRGRSRQALQGEGLYKKYCAVCHGDNADGNGFNASLLDPRPPNLIPLATPEKRDLVLDVIADGSAAAGKSALCPPWKNVLSEEQRQAIFEHLIFLAGAAKQPENKSTPAP